MDEQNVLLANDIYGILVEECGAHEFSREDFVYWFTQRGGAEFRFQGSLGFGGKFWRNAGRWYVSHYREDSTPEREATEQRANKRLQHLLDLASS